MTIFNKVWYEINHANETDSPALLVYPERIRQNIDEMIRIVGNPGRLVPHIKTHKMSAMVKIQLEANIQRFKCATIAEAEMLAKAGAEEVVIAYQLNESKILRLLQLIKKYPEVSFASLVDNMSSAQLLNKLFAAQELNTSVFIDIDNGMHRTGFPANDNIVALYKQIVGLRNIHCRGLHVYDGHIVERDFEKRKAQCDAAFAPIKEALNAIEEAGLPRPEIIAGGSPTFTIHALDPEKSCSPGTPLLWDVGYANMLPEQPFLQAAVLLTRIISKPTVGFITIDLGYKSVAAENPIDKRISFLNLKKFKPIEQSEEHLVIEIGKTEWEKINIGDILYAIPYHVCPTVALYDEVQVIKNGEVTGQWKVEARVRKITI